MIVGGDEGDLPGLAVLGVAAEDFGELHGGTVGVVDGDVFFCKLQVIGGRLGGAPLEGFADVHELAVGAVFDKAAGLEANDPLGTALGEKQQIGAAKAVGLILADAQRREMVDFQRLREQRGQGVGLGGAGGEILDRKSVV